MPYTIVYPATPGGPIFLREANLVEIKIPVVKNYGPGKQFDVTKLWWSTTGP